MHRIAIVAVLTIIAGCLVGAGLSYRHSNVTACTPGQGEICAPDQFMKDLADIQAFNAKYGAPQNEADRIQGVINRANNTIPLDMKCKDSKCRIWIPKTPAEYAQTKADKVKQLNDQLQALTK
jgi:hypothetical protein